MSLVTMVTLRWWRQEGWREQSNNREKGEVCSECPYQFTSCVDRFNPYQRFEKCRICKQQVHQVGSHYCQGNHYYGDCMLTV